MASVYTPGRFQITETGDRYGKCLLAHGDKNLSDSAKPKMRLELEEWGNNGMSTTTSAVLVTEETFTCDHADVVLMVEP